MLKACTQAWQASDLSKCAPVGIELVDWATIIGFLLALAGVLRFLVMPIARKLNLVGPKKIRSFRALKEAIRPYALDNIRLFETFGPRSSRTAKAPEEFDMATWHGARREIAKNNSRIAKIIGENRRQIPTHWKEPFDQWANHIVAFQAHLDDPNVDYRNHQFPQKINELFN